MKGQAFIGLPNEKAAAKALKEANGYVLFEKPMVVVSFSSNIYIILFVVCLSICSFAGIMFYQLEIYGKRKYLKTRQHSTMCYCQV